MNIDNKYFESYNSDDDLEDKDYNEDSFYNDDLIYFYDNIINNYNINLESCLHYKNKYKIFCEECNKDYNCEICHNNICKKHKLQKKNINYVICLKCNYKQKFTNKCKKCNFVFGDYICLKCKMVCDKKNYIHCDKCNICMDKMCFLDHQCIDNLENEKCSICLDNLFNSNSVKKMICGHYIHKECYKNLIKNSNRCPLCTKTIYIDLKEIEKSNLLIKDSKHIKNYYCNDCEIKFKSKNNKCVKCKLFNCDLL